MQPDPLSVTVTPLASVRTAIEDVSRGRRPPSSHHRQARSPRRWADRRDDYGGSRRHYHDRDRPGSGGGSGSREGSSTPEPERPSKEIMMDGLAPHLTEHHVRLIPRPTPFLSLVSTILQELREYYHVDKVDDVRIIRDRQTKRPRGFGFLRFGSLDDAQAFMARHQPVLYLYGDSDSNRAHTDPDSARVRISYGRERKEGRAEEADWTCSSCHVNNFAARTRCFSCQTARTAPNVGDNDASPDDTPSQFLLFRGLEPSVTEEHFAKGVAKLNKPTAAAAQTPSSTRTTKVASTTGDANLGAREGTLRRVLLVRDRRSNESWRYGFAEYASTEDAQAALTRYNSFDRFTIASKQILVSYIHAGVFVPMLAPTPSTERFLFSPMGNPSLKLQYRDLDAYLTELVLSTPGPDTDKAAAVSEAAEAPRSGREADKAKKRKARSDPSTPAPKKTASHLQFWSNRHAELHGIDRRDAIRDSSEPADDGPATQSFADPERHCCYLCMRRFTSTAQINKHERLSNLHRRNFHDPAKVARAKHKLDKHGVARPAEAAAAAVEYRDRAKERRKTYGVINKKGEPVGKGPRPPLGQAGDEQDREEGRPRPPSKGASLLSKMGYTAGQGLGANAEGMKEPIKQDVYVAGVGLGAHGGRVGDAIDEADKNTKDDYRAWVEKGRDNMRERYRHMG
ncbi:hypothetical protein DV736_g519, partial [Chaetothyriales sp. CBS 134916]